MVQGALRRRRLAGRLELHAGAAEPAGDRRLEADHALQVPAVAAAVLVRGVHVLERGDPVLDAQLVA